MEYDELKQQAWVNNDQPAMKIFELADEQMADVLDDLNELCLLLGRKDLSKVFARHEQPAVARILGAYGET